MTSHLEKIEKHTQPYIHTYIHTQLPKKSLCHLSLVTYHLQRVLVPHHLLRGPLVAVKGHVLYEPHVHGAVLGELKKYTSVNMYV